MLATPAAPSIVVQGNVEGSIVAGDHNFVVNTNYGTIIHQQAAPRVKRRELAPAAPRFRRDFVGRTRELSALDRFISQRGAVVVSGLEGLGKTTLVKQIANGPAAHACPHGVVYLEGVDEQGTALDLGDVIQRLFDALFESEPPLKVNLASARTYLSNTQPLVVLDRLALPAGAMHSLPDLFPRGALLVTATESPMENDLESIPMGPLARAESVQLLATRARLEVTDSNRTPIDSVCALLADVPLAIVTAANVIREKNMPLDQAAHRLANVKPASADSLRAGIERAFAFAFAALAPEEQKMLSAVATLPGVSIDRPWLESAQGGQAVSAQLERLELLQANSPRLRIPPGLRALAVREVNEQSVREELFAHLNQALTTRSLDFEFVADELGNLLGLHEWLFGEQRWADVIALGQAIDPYLTLRGLWNAWRSVLERILHAARASGNALTEGWALHQLGTREIGAGERTRAIALLEQALALRRSIGDVIGAAHTRHNLDVLVPPPPSRPPEAQAPRGPDWGAVATGFLGGGLAILIVGLIVGLVMANFDAIIEQFRGLSVQPVPSSTPTDMVIPTDPSPTPTWTPMSPVGCQGKPDIQFSASPSSISPKDVSTLSWATWPNVDSVEIDQGIGKVGTSSSVQVGPGQTTTYALTVRCGPNVSYGKVTVTVINPPLPPQVGCQGSPNVPFFNASPTIIQPGQSARLNWGSVTNADSVSIDPGVGRVKTPDSKTVSPKQTTTYTLTARCGSQAITVRATVAVSNPPTSGSNPPSSGPSGSNPPSSGGNPLSSGGNPPPSGSNPSTSGCQGTPYIKFFSASPSTINLFNSSTLSWATSPNADSVDIDQGIGPVKPSDVWSVAPQTTTTYTLTVRCGPNVSYGKVTVTVINPPLPPPVNNPPPPPSPTGCQGTPYIKFFSASPSTIKQGDTILLSWDASPNADSVDIDQGIGPVGPSGSTKDTPKVTTTYTLTVYCGKNPPATQQTTVTVY